jgi:hypothetical protein
MLCWGFSRGTPRQATWETYVSEGRNYEREMAGQFGLWFRLPRKLQGSCTCRKSATWDRRLYFPSEKSDGFGRVRTREASMLTTRPPKPLPWNKFVTRFALAYVTKPIFWQLVGIRGTVYPIICLLVLPSPNPLIHYHVWSVIYSSARLYSSLCPGTVWIQTGMWIANRPWVAYVISQWGLPNMPGP